MTIDVVVVGAGPAGSVTALLLARSGWRVVLVDRAEFPRSKACGECVNPGAVRRLTRLGLTQKALGIEPATLRGWTLRVPSGPGRRAWFPDDIGEGWGIERRVLDDRLLQAAIGAGVDARLGVRVEGVTIRADAPAEVQTQSGTLSARMVVAADGLRSRVARSLGWVRRGRGPSKASQTIRIVGVSRPSDRGHLVLDRAETLGLAPVGGSAWNLTRVVPGGRGADVASDPADLLRRAAGRIAGLDAARPDGRIRASGPFHWITRRVIGPGIVLVGDAAGYYDPLTGQGIHRAIFGAEEAARVIDDALNHEAFVSEDSLAPYARSLRRAQAPGRRVQRSIEWLLGHPSLLAGTLSRLDRAGTLGDLVAVTGDARPVRSLLTPRHLRLDRPGTSRHERSP
jgi:flavin-dependent dehydrogenase